MSVWEYQYTDELYHHGIKGQKWGVRRYQNSNGTLTSAGKQRYSDKPKRKLTSDEKKVIAKKVGLGLAGAAALAGAGVATAYGIKNYSNRYGRKNPINYQLTKELSKTVASEIGDRAKIVVANAGKQSIKSLEKNTKRAGKAMAEAMVASAGTIAISKLTKKYAIAPTDDEETRQAKQMLLNMSTAGITAFTSAGSSNTSSKVGNTQGVRKEIVDTIGPPSNKGIDRQSSEYQALFNGRDENSRNVIRGLANTGYDIGQINEYLDKQDRRAYMKAKLKKEDELKGPTVFDE